MRIPLQMYKYSLVMMRSDVIMFLQSTLGQSWWKPLTEDRPATPEPAWTIPSSDLSMPTNNWASALKSTHAPPQENSLLAQTGDMATFMDWFCKQRGISELTPKDLEGPAFEIVKVFHHDVIHLQFQMEECHKLLTDQVDDAILRYNVSKPLPLGGEPGHVTIQPDFFFNKDLEYLRYGRKVGRPALSISKMKAAYYPDVGLEQLCMVSLIGGFKDNDSTLTDSHLKETAEQNLVIRHRVEDFQLGIESYQTQLNLTKPRWEATGFEFKHDYTVIDSPRAVTFRDRYGVQMIMRFNEIHKFSDGTLQQIDEALDYRVKEFQINRTNPGMNTRFWTKKDVDRSKDFIFAIQKRLKTRRIFRNLESFVGGRIREGDYRDGMVQSNVPMIPPEPEGSTQRQSTMDFNPLIHSFRALSILRRSGLRTASAAAKPYQGDSSEVYLITGRIPMVAAAGQKRVNPQPHAHTSYTLLKTS
ncbi:hypothetical protein Tco_0629802 [Tanacetum coccineum]|uniref:Uncharacterized protein n=1 Tax=Tanacetum coccineum TaxID=301880 RepID=A0ABQ4WU74_9ASTR